MVPTGWLGIEYPQWSRDDRTDEAKYVQLASAVIDSDQSIASLSDARCLISFGPFTLHPLTDPHPDTIAIAFGIESGQNLSALRLHAERAKIIYLDNGQVSVDEPQGTIPSRFELFQNFPNPFNPTTTIRFAVPRVTHVRLIVMNILGEEVATLVDHPMQGGIHSIVWDAGGKPSGVYFYRIQTGQFVETRKLILLR